MTSDGVTPVMLLARWKNRRAASLSRRVQAYTSMTCAYWSTARYQVYPPPGDLDVGLVHVPAVADPVPTEPGRVG
jgi:hypothetical protein